MARSTIDSGSSDDKIFDLWFKRILNQMDGLIDKYGNLHTELVVLRTRVGLLAASIAFVVSLILSGVVGYIVRSASQARIAEQQVEIDQLRQTVKQASTLTTTPTDMKKEIEILKRMIEKVHKQNAARTRP